MYGHGDLIGRNNWQIWDTWLFMKVFFISFFLFPINNSSFPSIFSILIFFLYSVNIVHLLCCFSSISTNSLSLFSLSVRHSIFGSTSRPHRLRYGPRTDGDWNARQCAGDLELSLMMGMEFVTLSTMTMVSCRAIAITVWPLNSGHIWDKPFCPL